MSQTSIHHVFTKPFNLLKAVIVYHGVDADGWMSATLVRHYCLENHLEIADYVPMDYSPEAEAHLTKVLEYDIEHIAPNKDLVIFMVDFTCSNEIMTKYAKYIRHYDHHASRLEPRLPWRDQLQVDGSSVFYPGRGTDIKDPTNLISACELVSLALYPESEIETAITLLGRRDVWDLSSNPHPFWEGMMFDLTKRIHSETKIAVSNVSDLVIMGWFDRYMLYEHASDERVESLNKLFVDTIKQGQQILEVHYYDNLKMTQSRSICKRVTIADKTYTIAFLNGSGNSATFDGFIKTHPEVTMAIFYFINAKSRMQIEGRALQHNDPVLDAWTYIEQEAGITPFRISMGGHKAACGGSYELPAILALVQYIRNL